MAELSAKERKILWYVHGMGRVSRKRLLELSRLKSPTLYRVIETLVQEGYIVVSGSEEDKGKGRPTDILTVNRTWTYVFSVCITRTRFFCAAVDFGNQILAQRSHDILADLTPEAMVEQLFADFREICEDCGLHSQDFLGIGLSAVGPLDYREGVMIGPLHFHADGWYQVPIVKLLSSRFQMKVLLDCNASSALMGHYMSGYFDEYQNAVYVSVGTCIGSGLIIGQRLHTNRNIILDGFAHMIIDMDGRRCTCGEYGCVEAYASTTAILEQCSREIKLGAESILEKKLGHLKLEDLKDAVLAQDPLAIDQVQRAANIFAKCIVNYLRMVELDAVVLWGSLVESIPLFFEQVVRYAQKKEMQVKFFRSQQEERNILRGIASEVIEVNLLWE